MFGLFGGPVFNPDRDIPDLKDKTILVTGGNSGLGKEQLRYLAKTQAKLYMAARSKSRADAAISDIVSSVPNSKIHFLELDLGSFASIKAAADAFKRENVKLDALVNNAGIMGEVPGLTKDGYEVQFGTNHLGHFLLTKELMPLLEKAAADGGDVRIVNVGSEGHRMAPSKGWLPDASTTDMKEFSTWTRYGHSKICNNLFSLELARRYPQIASVTIHPGAVFTNLGHGFKAQHPWLDSATGWLVELVMKSVKVGALNQTWATVAPIEGRSDSEKTSTKKMASGKYYTPVAKDGGENKLAKDADLAKQLWEWSETEVKKHGY